MVYAGIDLHKHFSVITLVNDSGVLINQSKIRNSAIDILNCFAPYRPNVSAVVETTTGWYWLDKTLTEMNIPLTLAHAKFLKAIAYAKVKTDKVDSMTMAQLLRMDYIPQAYKLDESLRQLRDLMRARLRLVSKKAACLNSMHRLLEKFNLTPDLHKELDPLYLLQYQQMQDQRAFIAGQIKTLENTLIPTFKKNIYIQRLMAAPGIGKINATSITLEIGDINRFPTVKHFFSYCRLVPGADNSGYKVKHKSGNKDGNRYLKLAFSDAAVHAVQYFPVIKKFHRTKLRKKHKRVAYAIVAKELARIVYHILKDNQDFNGKFKGVMLERQKKMLWPRQASPNSLTG